MEIGSLAEWMTGFAEMAAVIVALFLPYYQSRKTRKASQRRILNLINGLLDKLLAALSANPQLKLPTTNEFIDFHKLVTILAVTDGDLVNVDVLRRIEDLLSNDDDEYNHEQIANKVNDLRTSIRK